MLTKHELCSTQLKGERSIIALMQDCLMTRDKFCQQLACYTTDFTARVQRRGAALPLWSRHVLAVAV